MRFSKRSSVIDVSIAVFVLLLTAAMGCEDDAAKVDEFMERGLAAVEAEKDDEAIIEFRNVIQLDPNHAVAHYELAKTYLRTKQLNDAYWELTESVRLDPSNTKARLSYGAMSLAVGEFEEALAQAEAVVKALPEEGGGHILMGRALARLDRMEEAEAPFMKAIEVDPDEPTYTLALAAFYHRNDEFDKAEELYVKFTEMDPSFQSYTALGRFLVEDRERDEDSAKAFFNAIKYAEDPEDKREAYKTLAGFYFNRGRTNMAAGVLEEAIEESDDKLELIYLLARFYSSQGEDDKADALVTKATAEQADDPRTHLTLSQYRSRKGDMEGAIAAADAALQVDPDNLPAMLRKAELLVDLGFQDKAEAKIAQGRSIVEEILKREPTNSEGLFVRAKIEIAEEKSEEAVASLRAALDSRPNWAQAHFVLGSALLLLEDYQGARAEEAKAVELDPGLLDARRLLAAIHSHLGEYEYAIEHGRMYLRERPDHVKTRVLVAQSLMRLGRKEEATLVLEALPEEQRDVEALYAIAKIKLGDREFEQARELLLIANEMAPHHPEILKSLLGAESQLGLFEESALRIMEAVAADPQNPRLVLLKANTEMVAGDLGAAEGSYQLASDLDPENLEAYQQLAHFYRLVGRLDKAISTLEDSVKARPNSAVMHQRLAVLYEMDGQIPEAKVEYEKAIELDGSLGESKNNLAYLLAEEGQDLERALDLAQEAKGLLPDSPNTADTLGWVLLKRGVPAAAIGYLREAVAGIDPADPAINVIRQHLAEAYEANGERDRAVETLEEALQSLRESTEAAQAEGKQTTEPKWAAEARATITRLRENPAG